MSKPKIALITGGNRGIGYEICRQLGQKGHTILLGARDAIRGEAAANALAEEGINVRFLLVNMADPGTFHTAFDTIEKEYGRLDILINNAAIAIDGDYRVTNIPRTILQETFDNNFFSHVELTQILLPLLQKSDAACIVNQSSILGSLTCHSMPDSPIKDARAFAYNASKTAMNAFTVHLAAQLEGTGIKVNSAHPGNVRSDMNPHGELTLEEGAKTAVELALLEEDDPTGGYFYQEHLLSW